MSFGVRISAYKLNNKQYEDLNLEPFTDFIHEIMELLAKGKTDMSAFAGTVDKLVQKYSINDEKYYRDILEIIFNSNEALNLDTAIESLVVKQNFENQIKALVSNNEDTLNAVNNLMKKPGKYDNAEQRYRENDRVFKALFGKGNKFEKAVYSKCSEAILNNESDLMTCRMAQLTFRLQDMLYRNRISDFDAKGKIRRLLYTLDRSDIYIDAAFGDQNLINNYNEFVKKVGSVLAASVNDGTINRAAINDSLNLTAAVAQALTYEQEDAVKWLKQFQKDLRTSSIKSMEDIISLPSLDWFNKDEVPYYTGRMRSAFKHILVTPQIYLYSWKNGERDIDQLLKFIREVNNAISMITLNFTDKPTVTTVINQLAALIKAVSENMPNSENEQVKQFASAIDGIYKILSHAQDRDWVAISFDINDQLLKHKADKIEIQHGLQFSRTLLSMYQASSVEEAKGIFQSTLEHQASRKTRYGQDWTVDIAALVGARYGSVQQEWDKASTNENSTDDGYGIYAPFGIQFAGFPCLSWLGVMVYPIDLGAYISGSNSDESPEIRVQSALHGGAAIYLRPSKKMPFVFGISGDYKPRFGNDDSEEKRVSGFLALELPLFIIK